MNVNLTQHTSGHLPRGMTHRSVVIIDKDNNLEMWSIKMVEAFELVNTPSMFNETYDSLQRLVPRRVCHHQVTQVRFTGTGSLS